MIKLNPLAYWTNAQVWEYIRERGVPYNVLHDRGFSSIGDEMNTRPVKDGEEERAGRFDQSVKVTECGMHTHLAKARASIKRAQSSGTPHLPCPSCVDVDKTNFQEVVLQAKQDMLIEFYSPMCGHCTHFAPTYAEIANRLAKAGEVTPARMDLYSNDLPKVAVDAGFDINAFPTLILLRRNPETGKLRLIQFDRWRRDAASVLGWVSEKRTQLKKP